MPYLYFTYTLVIPYLHLTYILLIKPYLYLTYTLCFSCTFLIPACTYVVAWNRVMVLANVMVGVSVSILAIALYHFFLLHF